MKIADKQVIKQKNGCLLGLVISNILNRMFTMIAHQIKPDAFEVFSLKSLI